MSEEIELPEKYQGRDDEEELKQRYKEMLFEPGEAAGVVGAQSISEPATQMTMETYHSAGAAKVSVTLGLPRLIEIIDARKNPKTPVMNVYLEEDFRNEEDARKIAAKIQEVKFKDIVSQDSFDIAQLELEFVLDEDVLEEFIIDREDVKDKLENKLSATITIEENAVRIAPDKDDYDLTDLQDLKKKASGIRLKGLKGIDHVVILEEDGEWRIQTAGINYRKVLKLDGVDASRTTCNNFFDVKKVLGIEAARNAIMNEINSTLDEQGINVDVRWLLMMADTMTKDGDIQGATRYGITGNKNSVLARASFEETKKHLTNAALHGEVDPVESVLENLILGQVIPVGTGLLDLKAEPGKAQPVEEPTVPIEQEEEEPEPVEEDDGEEESVEETIDEDVSELTVDDVKELVESGDLSAAQALEQETDGKNRSTLVDWLERRAETEETDVEEAPTA